LIRNRLRIVRPTRGRWGAAAAVLGLAAAVVGLAAGLAARSSAATPDSESAAPAGGEIFAHRCAVCHGPQAAGIPGSFPSLHEQIVGFAKLPEGRDYLVMVVTTGLMGPLQVGGVSYNGVMPAQSGLSDADIAAVLNYLAGDLGKNDLGAAALSAGEVAAARARHPDTSAQSTRALRPAAVPAAGVARVGGAPVDGAPSWVAPGGAPPLGIANGQRAWQHWTLNCQGCHRPDGSGSPATAPGLTGTVARFLGVPGGREYLGRVPGVATAPLSDADLSEVMNWMLWRFDPEHVPANFQPFTAAEIGALRQRPLRLEASRLRADLLSRAD
jgi:mono/diheme cytochrome c family protein